MSDSFRAQEPTSLGVIGLNTGYIHSPGLPWSGSHASVAMTTPRPLSLVCLVAFLVCLVAFLCSEGFSFSCSNISHCHWKAAQMFDPGALNSPKLLPICLHAGQEPVLVSKVTISFGRANFLSSLLEILEPRGDRQVAALNREQS